MAALHATQCQISTNVQERKALIPRSSDVRRNAIAFSAKSSTNAAHQHGVIIPSGKPETRLLANGKRRTRPAQPRVARQPGHVVVSASAAAPLTVIISGAPASGKGTQCASIVQKYGLVHISAGDLLRAEVALGTEAGKTAKKYMDAGNLVPDEVVVTMVKSRLAQEDCRKKGWLLDGYPRSASQAAALEQAHIRPRIFLNLRVPDEILVERVAGRRLDPVTGTIYHLKFSPPPPEILPRLTQRSDDNESAIATRVRTHNANVTDVLKVYGDLVTHVDGNRAMADVFADIDAALSACVAAKA
eukprot:jgi/Mesvir1/6309/Mv03170-RA.1